MIYSNDTYDVIQDISTYTRRDFKSVYDTSRGKWYMLNNLNAYEEYGIYGTDFSSYYVGKLVEVNGHEYEWDGTEWDDLGADGGIPWIQFPENNNYNQKNNSAWFIGPHIKNTDTIEIKFYSFSWNKWRQVLGCNVNNNSQEFLFSVFENTNGRNFGHNYWNYGETSRRNNDNQFTVSANTIHILKIHVGTGNIELDGGSTISGNGNNAEGTSYEPLLIGCAPAGYGDPGFYGRIYYLKIYDENNNVTFYAQAANTGNVPGFVDSISQTSLTKEGNGTVTYGEDSGGKPKEYPTKAAPTITNYWNSRVFRNGSLIVKALQSDELLNLKYKDKNVLIKSEHERPVKFQKVIDWSTLTDGDEIVFVNESTGLVATNEMNNPSNTSTTLPTTALALIMSLQTVNIANNEFLASDLNNITQAYYYSGSTSLWAYTPTASPLVLKVSLYRTVSGVNWYDLLDSNNNNFYISSTTNNRKLKIGARPSGYNLSWKIESNSIMYNYSGNYVYLKTGGNGKTATGTTGYTYWIGNYPSSYSPTWDLTIYKKVQ